MTDEFEDMIAQAVAEGRLNRLPTAPAQPRPSKQTRFHPETCGGGRGVERAPHLDELDGDYA